MKYSMSYVKKLAKNLERVVGKENRIKILKGCETLTSRQSKQKRAQVMKMVIERMEKNLDEKDLIEIREACACKPRKFLKTAKDIRAATDTLEDFL